MKRGKAAEVRRFSELQAEMKAAATVVFERRLRRINCARIWAACDGVLQLNFKLWRILAAAELRFPVIRE